MTNAIRGEAALEISGSRYTLLLTLGALAAIEEGLGLADLSAIGARLKHPHASDIAVIAAALLNGGGHAVSPRDVLALPVDLGVLLAAIGQSFARAGLAQPATPATPDTAEPFRPFAGPTSLPSG